MNYPLVYIDNLEEYCHKVIKNIVNSPKAIANGRPDPITKLIPREVLGLFLVCSVARYLTGDDWTISSDPEMQDGTVFCKSGKRMGEGFATEQVYIPKISDKGEDLAKAIISAIENNKSSKGSEYSKNRHLIVFVDRHGQFIPAQIISAVAKNAHYLSYWLIGRNSPEPYMYLVFTAKSKTDPIEMYNITFSKDFKSWSVDK